MSVPVESGISVPEVSVGILSSGKISVRCVSGSFSIRGQILDSTSGEEEFVYDSGSVRWRGELYGSLDMVPESPDSLFSLHDVVIGVSFHWERKENQIFEGSLKLIPENGHVTAVNTVDVESYLESVVSSEMNASSPLQFLMAHSVISRSWLLAQLGRRDCGCASDGCEIEGGYLKWYDREAHHSFDVCADDHCQRYQGRTRITDGNALEAVRATRGEVLMYGGEICDARFSKCCGGITESFGTCWGKEDHPYLATFRDTPAAVPCTGSMTEDEARRWILSAPESFCSGNEGLESVLNSYDLEHGSCYRWRVVYVASELSSLVRRKSGKDLGTVLSIEPLERGASGRIWKLKITGTSGSLVVGKELEIRRVLSETHLFSSAFVVDRETVSGEDRFVIHGAGWGHGVGLCQIGAAAMAEKGYGYREILSHYFPGAGIKCIY